MNHNINSNYYIELIKHINRKILGYHLENVEKIIITNLKMLIKH